MEYSGPRRRRRRARENEIFAFRRTAWSMPMPLQCHEMKISQPGEQINSELCHAIFVGHYMRFLFIPETVPQKCSELRRHRGSILPVVLQKKE